MATKRRDKNTLEVYLRQYEQCWEDKRALEAMIWQTPAVFLAIVAVLLAGLISRGFPSVDGYGSARLVTVVTYSAALLFAFAVSSVGTVQMRKHRLFCFARVDDLRFIESNLRSLADVHLVQFTTKAITRDKRYPDIKGKWLDRRSAYNWLFALSLTVTVLLLVVSLAWPLLAYLDRI